MKYRIIYDAFYDNYFIKKSKFYFFWIRVKERVRNSNTGDVYYYDIDFKTKHEAELFLIKLIEYTEDYNKRLNTKNKIIKEYNIND